jgi:NADH-quinone oxidoreductase subunit E
MREPLPPAIELIAEVAVAPQEPGVTAALSPGRSEFDEDAAMRAIEGGWSRRQTRAMSDAYQLTDVTAAVSAAQIAVEQVLAANGIDAGDGTRAQSFFGKPRGVPHPRNNRRDNLKQINGLGPLDESTLNNLGIFHFDQVAGWDQKEVLWLENHAFARGRIGREDWQGQARSLMVDSEAARRIGG